MTSLEATNSVFNISNENKSFPFGVPGYWRIPNYFLDGIIGKLKELLELRSQNDFDIQVKKFEKGVLEQKKENSGYNLAGFGRFKSEILAELRRVKHLDLEDLVYRMESTYDEIMDALDIKYTSATSNGYTLPSGLYETIDIFLMLKSVLPDDVEVKYKIDDNRKKIKFNH